MKLAFRNAFLTFSTSCRFFLNPTPKIPFPPLAIRTAPTVLAGTFLRTLCCSTTMEGGESHAPSLEKQFEGFRVQLEESGSLRERIRAVVMEIESTARLMQAGLLLVHQSRSTPEVLERPKAQIAVLKGLYNQLAQILSECPSQYYRGETQTVASLLAFMHWLETGNLLLHTEAEEKLGLNSSEFGLDVEDYLVGLCFMSNELPRYVVNQVTAGDYDCPRKVLKFLTELHAAFRMLNLRNDFLRKKFDGMKYDLKRVEEVHYDVKIRGLTARD
ncbi:hypothetical protein G4B88_008088 [Cannabis sativa]|uniref:Translin n=1 Tax=Cannabis sativa TaxID=3483 RepID=A0A7J6I756_CANSA|nr:hypothetical protein G4B88_008088 [Cannabis sativa]